MSMCQHNIHTLSVVSFVGLLFFIVAYFLFFSFFFFAVSLQQYLRQCVSNDVDRREERRFLACKCAHLIVSYLQLCTLYTMDGLLLSTVTQKAHYSYSTDI